MDGSNAAKELLDKTYQGGIKETVSLSDDAKGYIEQYFEASVEEDNAKAKKQEAANKIKELMGDHNKASCGEHTMLFSAGRAALDGADGTATDNIRKRSFRKALSRKDLLIITYNLDNRGEEKRCRNRLHFFCVMHMYYLKSIHL